MSGRFKSGVSGNPNGRPKGVPNPSTELRKAISDHVPGIIARLAQAALEGDVAAASLLLSRVLPPVKPESSPQALPDQGRMSDRAEQIVSETMAGNLSPSSAGELIGVLVSQAKIVEISDLAQRLAELEARLK